MRDFTTPKITEDQHDSLISAIRKNDSPGTCTSELTNLLKWPSARATRNVTIKNCATKHLHKFVNMQKGCCAILSHIHENNGTLVACDGYRAAVILPESMPEWDMSDAYLIDEFGSRHTIVQTAFSDIITLSKVEICSDILSELRNACGTQIKEHKRILSEQKVKYKKVSPPDIYIEPGKMKAISLKQATEIYESNNGSPMRFNADYLYTALRFILCAATDKVECYYSLNTKPVLFHSENLYALLFPLRIRAQA